MDIVARIAAFGLTMGLAVTAWGQQQAPVVAPAQPTQEALTQQQAEEAKIESYLEAVKTVLRNIDTANDKRDVLNGQLSEHTDGQDTSLIDAELKELELEVLSLEENLATVAFGADALEYRPSSQREPFDAEQEILALFEPFILIAQDATEGSRKIEAQRQRIKMLSEREEIVDGALRRMRPLMERISDIDPQVADFLREWRATWWQRKNETGDLLKAAELEFEAMQQARSDASRAQATAMMLQVGKGVITLLLGVGAGLLCLALAMLAQMGIRTLWRRTLTDKEAVMPFGVRIALLAFSLIGILGAFGAAIVVFERRNDWLLLGLAVLLLVGVGWILMRTWPSVLEQARLLLNLGSVQEGERLVLNGVPYRVMELNFYSKLDNPALEGGLLEMPVQMLVGHLSRPQDRDEPWFPTAPGDWVRLDGEVLARVQRQTPEAVYLVFLGGATQTIPTAEFLSRNVENLSHGVRIEFPFGVDFKHIVQAMDHMEDEMAVAVRRALDDLLAPGHVTRLDVEFQGPTASSLDFEVEIDLAGAALGDDADIIHTVRHVANKALVKLCLERGWTIPFNQMVVHRA